MAKVFSVQSKVENCKHYAELFQLEFKQKKVWLLDYGLSLVFWSIILV